MSNLKWLRWPAKKASLVVENKDELWSLEIKEISELKPYLKNPRFLTKRDAEHLKKSIKKFGMIDKPIVNSDNTIIGGHQRVNILADMGYQMVECWVSKRLLSEHDLKELCIRLNRNHGTFDLDILANDFDEEDLIEWGFSEIEIPSAKLEEDDISSAENEENHICPACNRKVKKRGSNGKT